MQYRIFGRTNLKMPILSLGGMRFQKLKVKKIDLLAIHGINTAEHLHQAIRDGGCIDILRNFQKKI